MAERDWIDRYIRPIATAPGAQGLRDDVARLRVGGVQIATMDTLVEGRHFLSCDPIDTVGRKLVRVNVSDVHAKGALPLECLLSVAWPVGRAEADFAAFMQGMARDLAHFECDLIGGDFVTTTGPLVLTLTMTGRCFGAQPVRRHGAKVGDGVFVSGDLGWGALGLEAAFAGTESVAARRYRVPDISSRDEAVSVAKIATASMDVSDGLLIDARSLALASGVSIVLDLGCVPLAKPTDRLDMVLRQCTGGDDYQILMTAPDGETPDGFIRIGDIESGEGLRLKYKNEFINLPETLGFEH